MTRFECPVCGDEYKAAGALRDHAWTVHGACHYCGESFDDEETLYVHWLATHEGELSRADRKRADTEVGELTVGDRFVHQGPWAAVTGVSRRSLLIAGGAALAGGAATVGGVFSGATKTDAGSQKEETETSRGGGDSQPGAVASAPVPSSPAEHRYPVMGPADAAVTVTYFGSWKCPHCARFSTGFLSTLVRDYVDPGKITLKFRDLAYINGDPFLGPDAPAAGRAGLAVWNDDPQSYWAYHEAVMANQPSDRKRWATADRLVSVAQHAGVADPSVVRTAIDEQKYEDTLRATSTAAADAGVQGVPTLLVNGTTVSPFNEAQTRQLIEDAIA